MSCGEGAGAGFKSLSENVLTRRRNGSPAQGRGCSAEMRRLDDNRLLTFLRSFNTAHSVFLLLQVGVHLLNASAWSTLSALLFVCVVHEASRSSDSHFLSALRRRYGTDRPATLGRLFSQSLLSALRVFWLSTSTPALSTAFLDSTDNLSLFLAYVSFLVSFTHDWTLLSVVEASPSPPPHHRIQARAAAAG